MPRLPGFSDSDSLSRYAKAYDATLASAGVAVRTRQVPTSLGSTHVVEAGAEDKPPLVLLHAMSFSASLWVRNLAALSAHHRVVAIDTIGDVNLSRSERRPHGRDDFMGWLAEVLQAMQIGRTAIAGNSYGGWIAAHFARERPELVSHLVLISPAVVLVKFRPAFYAQTMRVPFARTPARAERFARFFVGDVTLQNASAKLWLDQVSVGMPFFRGLLRFPPPRGPFTDAELAAITAPVLLIEGEHEPIHNPVAAVTRAKERIPSVKAVLLQDTWHVAELEQPERVNELILDHISD